MGKIVIMSHPETGALFTPTKKEGWVKCRVESTDVVVNSGVITLQKRVAFPLVQQAVADHYSNLKSGDTFPIDGKIIRTVTSKPQFEGHQEVINPETGEAMGYYQSYEFTADMKAYDTDSREATTEKVEEKVENKAFENEV